METSDNLLSKLFFPFFSGDAISQFFRVKILDWWLLLSILVESLTRDKSHCVLLFLTLNKKLYSLSSSMVVVTFFQNLIYCNEEIPD